MGRLIGRKNWKVTIYDFKITLNVVQFMSMKDYNYEFCLQDYRQIHAHSKNWRIICHIHNVVAGIIIEKITVTIFLIL